MENNTHENMIQELNYKLERMNFKNEKLLDMITNQANIIADLEVDNTFLHHQNKELNKQLQEAQG